MPNEQAPSLFGDNPAMIQQALNQQQQAQSMAYGANMGPQNNPFYVPGIAAGLNQGGAMLGNAVGGMMGNVPPQIAEAYKMQEIQKETDKAGIDFGQDPVGYMKVAASNLLKAGMQDKALQVMNQALSWDSAQAETEQFRTPKVVPGPKPSDREEAMAFLMPAMDKLRSGGQLTPMEHNQAMAAMQIVEPPITSDAGSIVTLPNSLREEYQNLRSGSARAVSAATDGAVQGIEATPAEKAFIAHMRKKGIPDAAIVVELNKRFGGQTAKQSGPISAYGTGKVQTEGGGTITPNPYKQTKELNEAVDRTLNDVRQKPIVAVYEAMSDLEKVLSKYDGNKDVPGLGVLESIVTQGQDGMLKSIGRMGYQQAEGMGSERAAEANKILQALDQFMALDISRWAGASQTIPEATRQQLRTALQKGAVDQNVIDALKAYKKVLNADMAAYFGGLDPAVKERLLQDKSYGPTFKKIFEAKDFGQDGSSLPPGSVPTGRRKKGTNQKEYKAPDGSLWVE